jgi:hypothetical protein
LPSGVERAIADGLSLEHPDVLWTLPATLPSLADLRVSVDMLDQQCGAKATRQHVAWCVSKLAMAFESGKKLSDEDAKFRASIWLESCGDLGDALWSEATMAAIQSSKWMPKPAEFRAFVGTKLEARAKRLKRCREMLEAKAKQEPGAVPVRTMVPKIDQLRKLLRQQLDDTGIPEDHRLFNSANTERSLAWFEKRPIEPWARDVLAPMPSAQPQRSEHTHHVGEKARAVMSTMQKSVEPWRYGEPVYQRAQPPGGEEPPPHDHIPEAMEMDP